MTNRERRKRKRHERNVERQAKRPPKNHRLKMAVEVLTEPTPALSTFERTTPNVKRKLRARRRVANRKLTKAAMVDIYEEERQAEAARHDPKRRDIRTFERARRRLAS